MSKLLFLDYVTLQGPFVLLIIHIQAQTWKFVGYNKIVSKSGSICVVNSKVKILLLLVLVILILTFHN